MYKILLCSASKKNIQKYFTRCFVKKKKNEDLELHLIKI